MHTPPGAVHGMDHEVEVGTDETSTVKKTYISSLVHPCKKSCSPFAQPAPSQYSISPRIFSSRCQMLDETYKGGDSFHTKSVLLLLRRVQICNCIDKTTITTRLDSPLPLIPSRCCKTKKKCCGNSGSLEKRSSSFSAVCMNAGYR